MSIFLHNIVERFDKALPVAALTLLLLLQSLMALGATSHIPVEGAYYPDGTQVTLADLCNNVDAADEPMPDCHACMGGGLDNIFAAKPDIVPTNYGAVLSLDVTVSAPTFRASVMRGGTPTRGPPAFS